MQREAPPSRLPGAGVLLMLTSLWRVLVAWRGLVHLSTLRPGCPQAGVRRKWVLHLEAVCVKLMRGVLGALVGSGAGLPRAADYVPVTA